MIVIACVDDNFGMMFHQRRQSQDRALRARVLGMTEHASLWMNQYSAKQFSGMDAPQIQVDDLFLEKAAKGDYCFVEDQDLLPYEAKIEKLILYHWNRRYPADLYCSISPQKGAWKRVQISEFAGYSHETITEEIYIK